jgi:hypothetical protein
MTSLDANYKSLRWPTLLMCGLLFAAVTGPVLLGIGMPPVRSADALYLWAWQRNEDLSFLDPSTTRIALWVGTISVGDDRISMTPRQNPVQYPEGTELLPVVRIDVDRVYDAGMAARVAEFVEGLAAPLAATELQVDFDARVSQRDFYGALIAALRTQLPGWKLSITALASWCLGDPWLDALGVDAAVPMLYRMGSDGPRIRQYLSEQGHFPATICRDNIGYSSDEPAVAVDGAERVFWYHPTAWNEEAFTTVSRALPGVDGP